MPRPKGFEPYTGLFHVHAEGRVNIGPQYLNLAVVVRADRYFRTSAEASGYLGYLATLRNVQSLTYSNTPMRFYNRFGFYLPILSSDWKAVSGFTIS